MEPFKIKVRKEILIVHPLENESYNIFSSTGFLGVINPQIDNDLGLVWTSADLIAPDYVKEIGEAIERHDM